MEVPAVDCLCAAQSAATISSRLPAGMVMGVLLRSSLYVELSSTVITPSRIGFALVTCLFHAFTAAANVPNMVLATAFSSRLTPTCHRLELLNGAGPVLVFESHAERSYGPAPRSPLNPYT